MKETASSLVQRVEDHRNTLDRYWSFADEDTLQQISRRGERLRGVKVAHVNATSMGGGVAEMLRSLVPLMNDIGIETQWYAIRAGREFFEVTKNIHNSLQGGSWQFDGRAHDVFLRKNREIAEELNELDVDLWVVHDPQPCPVRTGIRPFRQAIWHCHLDSSTPNGSVWNYVLRHLSGYDRLVFSLPDYANGSVPPERARCIRPAIDPLSLKNQKLPLQEARQILANLGIDPTRPLVTQVSRFDPWKDPCGVIEAYRLAKQEVPNLQLALVGVMEAQDDPEAERIFEQVLREKGEDPDIHLYTDPNLVKAREVNAFQTASTIIVQKSLREGFGLTVTEAMWKAAAVIGGKCGGIRVQIQDGHNGILVESPEECARKIVQLLRNPKQRTELGEKAKESVRKEFLMPRLMHDYVRLIEEVILGG